MAFKRQSICCKFSIPANFLQQILEPPSYIISVKIFITDLFWNYHQFSLPTPQKIFSSPTKDRLENQNVQFFAKTRIQML